MSGSGTSPIDHDVDRLVASRLAGFVTTLRDNAFAVGSREGEDAAAVIAEGYGERPELLRSAFKHLFSTRKAEWDKFDGIFDAFWLGKRVKSRSTITGASKPANNPSLKSLQDKNAERGDGEQALDQMPSPKDAPNGRGEGRMEGASQAINLAEVDFRKMSDPDQIAQAHAAAAQLAQAMRSRLT
ncbi:MAG TPA: carbon monoxide dehydrogenase, partial [Xanthobacteraceae bacterium]